MKELLEKILGQIKKTPEGVRAYEDLYHICLETQKTDIPLSVEYLKKLSDIIENRIPQSETDKELRSLFMLHKKVFPMNRVRKTKLLLSFTLSTRETPSLCIQTKSVTNR